MKARHLWLFHCRRARDELKQKSEFCGHTWRPHARHHLNAAARLVELRNPPSNRFEALGGDRNGQYSIRINDRWRICFCWAFSEDPAGKDPLMVPGDAVDVEIADYH